MPSFASAAYKRVDSAHGRVGRTLRGIVLVGSIAASFVANADPAKKSYVMLDVTGKFTPDTIIEAISQKATACWVPNDPAFEGFVVAGKRLDVDGKTVRLDFKTATVPKRGKAGRKADDGKGDGRVFSIHAVPTFSGGYAIFVEQSAGIDIVPSLKRSLSDVERAGVIAC